MKYVPLILLFVSAVCAAEGDAKPLYQNDFEKADAGKEASQLDFLVLGDGEFKVAKDGENKFLELTPTPLDTFGLLFGPTAKENLVVQARIYGTSHGRRHPVFGVGLNGVGAYILHINPAKKALELLKGEDVKVSVPYAWTSGTWTVLQLSIRKVKDGAWTLEGKAWEQGKEIPAKPLITFDETEEPVSGRPSVWGLPFSVTPIRFDDLLVTRPAP